MGINLKYGLKSVRNILVFYIGTVKNDFMLFEVI
jgi:hypothetical protein